MTKAPAITTLLWDVGGVLLSNAWDRSQRAAVFAQFGLDPRLMEARHADMVDALEAGRLDFDEYLRRLVFDRPRNFTPARLRAAVEARSRPRPATLELLVGLHRRGLSMATINNESRALHEWRMRRFQLGHYFSACCTSCYLGFRKPSPVIYRRALGIVHRQPAECVFIDDREENLAAPRALGMTALHFTTAARLARELRALGLRW